MNEDASFLSTEALYKETKLLEESIIIIKKLLSKSIFILLLSLFIELLMTNLFFFHISEIDYIKSFFKIDNFATANNLNK